MVASPNSLWTLLARQHPKPKAYSRLVNPHLTINFKNNLGHTRHLTQDLGHLAGKAN